jgi:hypothetical protein
MVRRKIIVFRRRSSLKKKVDPLGHRIEIIRNHPGDFPLCAKPGHLPLRVPKGIALNRPYSARQISFSGKKSANMAISQRLHGFEGAAISLREQSSHFVHEPVRDHPVRSAFNPFLQRRPIQHQTQLDDLVGFLTETVVLLMVDNGTSRQFQDLQSADDPDTVMGIDLRCRLFILQAKLFVKMGLPPPFHLLPEVLTQGFIRTWPGDQPAEQSPDVQPCTADNQDRFFLPMQAGDDPVGQVAVS